LFAKRLKRVPRHLLLTEARPSEPKKQFRTCDSPHKLPQSRHTHTHTHNSTHNTQHDADPTLR
jgi:hypothetical protein